MERAILFLKHAQSNLDAGMEGPCRFLLECASEELEHSPTPYVERRD